MKKLILFTAILSLSGCALSPAANTQTVAAQTQFTQACGAYGVAFATALQLREAGQLSPAQIADVSRNDQLITPLCTGPMPTNATAATTEVMAAVTTLAVLSKGK